MLKKQAFLWSSIDGALAQLARALAWHARGHRFKSDMLHHLYDFVFFVISFIFILMKKLNSWAEVTSEAAKRRVSPENSKDTIRVAAENIVLGVLMSVSKAMEPSLTEEQKKAFSKFTPESLDLLFYRFVEHLLGTEGFTLVTVPGLEALIRDNLMKAITHHSS